MSEHTALLHRTELLAELSDGELSQFEELGAVRGLRRDERITVEGEPAPHLYVVMEGDFAFRALMQAHPDADPRDTVVTTFGPGESVGWSGLLEPHRYTYSAVAREPGKVFEVSAERLQKLVSANQEIGKKLMAALATTIFRRLREVQAKLMEERALVIAEVGRRAPRG